MLIVVILRLPFQRLYYSDQIRKWHKKDCKGESKDFVNKYREARVAAYPI